MKAFLRYITRPSGLGRTPWWAAAVIHTGCAAMTSCFWFFDDAAKWVVPPIGLLVAAIFWGGTIKNFREDQRDLSNPKNHVNDIVGEGTPNPVWKKGNKPILEFERWVAARYERPYATVNGWLDSLTIDQVNIYVDEFDRYLRRHQ